ncbi:LysR family transcriptional regulator [Saccharomonospora sp. CUA-673]|uniref:LysR substrate-binding domain-containing protein n=1 Tax=Saccharomonospora sp. CUA-673 TaxID=1904969 RepID=UPI00095D7A4C|nr:LysR substrate-binding domain-containing protein [Saccharomonospora sp. CUA-673]OLT43994.1 LysR family transcriptional regulator [Saccharomonospora sp. CUA-673]
MFTIHQLRGFVAVAEEGHFGRAAQRLSMTQPPLSRQIQQLEKELRVTLIDRSGRTVRLTPAGRAFLRDARRLLNDAENATQSVRRVTDGRAGVLSLGFTATSGYGVLGTVLRAAARELPHVEIVLSELVTRDQIDRITAGTLDAGLVRPPTPPAVESRLVRSEALMAALPVDHPLAVQDEIALSALHGADVVGYSPLEARYFYDLVVGVLGAADVRPTHVQHAHQVHTVLALVEAGMGIALVPETAARLRFEGLVFRRVRTPVAEPVELHVAWRADNDNPALRTFLDLTLAENVRYG